MITRAVGIILPCLQTRIYLDGLEYIETFKIPKLQSQTILVNFRQQIAFDAIQICPYYIQQNYNIMEIEDLNAN